jgi:hypothetical protein
MRAAISFPSTPNAETRALGTVAKFMMLGRALAEPPEHLAARSGANGHMVDTIKALGAANTGGGWAADMIGSESAVTNAFISNLRHASIFYRLLDLGVIRAPFRTRLGLVTAGATAWVQGEGRPVPLTSLGLNDAFLEPVTASGLICATKEWLQATGADTSLNSELRRAVVHEVDAKFFDIVIDGDTPEINSTGDDLDAISLDVRALLAAVGPTVESKLLFVTTPAIAQALSCMTTLTGASAFPNIGPLGGEFLTLPLMVTDTLPDGSFALIDGSGIIAERGDIAMKMSDQTSIEMLETALQQDATTAAAAALVSMWQTNSVALMVNSIFGAKRHPGRDNAVAMLTSVSWGGAVPVS